MRKIFGLLALIVASAGFGSAFQGDAVPTPDEQDRILQRMHDYADAYVDRLPNFVCTVITQQLQGGRRGNKWRKGDELTAKMTYSGGKEERKLELVNGKPVQPGSSRRRTPLVTEGEFGVSLSRVLGPESKAVYEWSGWDTLRGRRVAVFNFVVDRQDSTLSLSLSELASATLGYHGSLYAEPETGSVLRFIQTADEIPPKLMTQSISTQIDYEERQIGGATFLLPVEASVTTIPDRGRIRNEMRFTDYQKFGAESDIRFGDAEPGAPPP